MKVFKRTVACAVTVMLAVLALVPFVTLAETPYINKNKDPNGDGRLTIADMTFILQCLGGKYQPTDISQLDMNDNGIITPYDALLVQMVDAGVISI